MRVLLIGSGCREHALAWKLKQSPLCTELYSYPGSEAMSLSSERLSFEDPKGYEEVLSFIQEKKVDLVVCGPEQPLAEGFADQVKELSPSCRVVGPSQKAAQLEASKSFAKEMMERSAVPTARHEVVESYEEALEKSYDELKENSGVVLKADGLASGKGVFVCHTEEEVKEALTRLKSIFSSESPKILIEEELVGREFSYFSLVNHQFHTPLGCAVDFKRLEEGDKGPNTGGMGAYTPVPWLPENWESSIKEQVVDPLLKTLADEGMPYSGILYCGLMLTKSGVKVIEFNVRLGDPEAQVLLASDSRDYLALFLEAFERESGYKPYQASPLKSIGSVLASEDYPYCAKTLDEPEFGVPVSLFENSESPYIFASGLKRKGDCLLPGKGRVMTVVGQSESSFSKAREALDKKVEEVRAYWPKFRRRLDIASKVLED